MRRIIIEQLRVTKIKMKYKYRVAIKTKTNTPIEFLANSKKEIKETLKILDINYSYIKILNRKTGKVKTI